jgi:hypothetical protein
MINSGGNRIQFSGQAIFRCLRKVIENARSVGQHFKCFLGKYLTVKQFLCFRLNLCTCEVWICASKGETTNRQTLKISD